MLTLCDALNKIGEESYLSERDSPDANINHFNLQCPIASDEVLNSDNTVAIYARLRGNPLNAKYVVRWILFPRNRVRKRMIW